MTQPVVIVTTREQIAELVRPVTSPDDWLPLREIPVPYRAALDAIRAGGLTASRVGRAYLVRRRDLDAWLEVCRVTPDQPRMSTEPASLGAQVLALGGRR